MENDRGLRPPPTGLSRLLFRLPVHLYRARLGWLFGDRLLMLTHTGRVTGRTRRTVVEIVERDPADGSFTVCSGYGPRADWYRNLMARPEAAVQVGTRTIPVTAEPLPADRAAEALVRYARRHPRAARSLSRLVGLPLDGSEAGYRRAAEILPFVRLVPRHRG
ncbi:nitroreductase family deazaflavin-dependent oxidoreductase [Thermobifida cellulosilytica]|uniref:Nitroreductase n=1 Tax=Thermobifida cellulosilytica TB100 TaxID=665004 RepID=A0A147KJQ5_THECS|nr:nitroreductase family deazaflavin-dependent oxidoreductase [Thermobifida cellulosilytica]KUP97517.1 hypothetical protein AC529_06740 [Thermobifida cellulosilytica TB100]